MDAAVQRFIETQAEKSRVKQSVMEAVGKRIWHASQAEGDDAYAKGQASKVEELDEFIAANGNATGKEGELAASMMEQAEAFVAAHAAMFALLEPMVQDGETTDPATGLTGHDRLVRLISALSSQGMVEEVATLTMFELVKFERQHIGATNRAKLRVGGKG